MTALKTSKTALIMGLTMIVTISIIAIVASEKKAVIPEDSLIKALESIPDPIHKFMNEKDWILDAQVPSDIVLNITNRNIMSHFDEVKLADNFPGSGHIDAWTGNPSDDTQMTRIRTVPENFNKSLPGRSLEVKYDVESRIEASNGFWIKFDSLDLSEFNYFTFEIRGNEIFGFSPMIAIGFIDSNRDVAVYRVDGIHSDWQSVRVNLKKKDAALNWRSIQKVYFIFKSTFVSKSKGIYYLDELGFLRVVE